MQSPTSVCATARYWSFGAALVLHAAVFGAPFLLRDSIAAYEPHTVHVFLVQGQALAPTPSPASAPASVPKRERQKPPAHARPAPASEVVSPVDTTSEPSPDPTPPREPAEDSATAAPAGPPAVVAPRFDPAYLHNQAPAYPTLSRRLHEQGRVLLRVFVKPDGTAQEVLVSQSSGAPRLDSAARSAVERWRFVPARRGDAAVGAWVVVPISFSLEG
jgi:periplasmic protein TonB